MSADTQLGDRPRIIALARQFPALDQAPGLKQWDPRQLDEWALTASSSEQHAAVFILSVWNRHHDWKVRRFDVIEALAT
jgi:hypothetical protein